MRETLKADEAGELTIRQVAIAVAIGLASGLLSGVMGVGGGVLAIPAMVMLLGVRQHRAHGTSLAMIVLTAPVSAFAYAANGNVDWALALVLAFGMSAGMVFGAKLMPRVPARRLRQGFAVVMLAVAVLLLMGQ